jgi:hypothetical protein
MHLKKTSRIICSHKTCPDQVQVIDHKKNSAIKKKNKQSLARINELPIQNKNLQKKLFGKQTEK